MRQHKALVLWILASVLMFIGMYIMRLWEYDALGSTLWSNSLAIGISFLLIFLGGLCFIASAHEILEEEEWTSKE